LAGQRIETRPLFAKPSALRPAKTTGLRECKIIAIQLQIFLDEVAVTVMHHYVAAEAFFVHLMSPSFSRMLRIFTPFYQFHHSIL